MSALGEAIKLPSTVYAQGGKHFVILHKSPEGPEFRGEGPTPEEAAEMALAHKRMWEDKMGEPE